MLQMKAFGMMMSTMTLVVHNSKSNQNNKFTPQPISASNNLILPLDLVYFLFTELSNQICLLRLILMTTAVRACYICTAYIDGIGHITHSIWIQVYINWNWAKLFGRVGFTKKLVLLLFFVFSLSFYFFVSSLPPISLPHNLLETVGLNEKSFCTFFSREHRYIHRVWMHSQSFVFHRWQEIKRIVAPVDQEIRFGFWPKKNISCHQFYYLCYSSIATHWKFVHECGFSEHSVLHFKVIISFWDRMRVCACLLFFSCHWMKTTSFDCWNERL